MMNRRSLLAILFCALVLAVARESEGSGLPNLDYFQSLLQPRGCGFCGRQVHADMKVAYQIQNSDTVRMACCLRCVITEAEQMGTSIRVLWVSDYVTRERLRPDRATNLVGSRINSDSGPPVEVPWSRREQSELEWDRCLPSVIAFDKRDEALKFQQRAGGNILTFGDLVAGTDVTSSFQLEMP